MTDDYYDIHPLDRDYSRPIIRPTRKLTQEEKLRRVGLATFGVGFLLVATAAILTNLFPKLLWIESLSSSIHRLALLTILVGGVILLVSFRYSELQAASRLKSRRNHRPLPPVGPRHGHSTDKRPASSVPSRGQPEVGEYGDYTPIREDEWE